MIADRHIAESEPALRKWRPHAWERRLTSNLRFEPDRFLPLYRICLLLLLFSTSPAFDRRTPLEECSDDETTSQRTRLSATAQQDHRRNTSIVQPLGVRLGMV